MASRSLSVRPALSASKTTRRSRQELNTRWRAPVPWDVQPLAPSGSNPDQAEEDRGVYGLRHVVSGGAMRSCRGGRGQRQVAVLQKKKGDVGGREATPARLIQQGFPLARRSPRQLPLLAPKSREFQRRIAYSLADVRSGSRFSGGPGHLNRMGASSRHPVAACPAYPSEGGRQRRAPPTRSNGWRPGPPPDKSLAVSSTGSSSCSSGGAT